MNLFWLWCVMKFDASLSEQPARPSLPLRMLSAIMAPRYEPPASCSASDLQEPERPGMPRL